MESTEWCSYPWRSNQQSGSSYKLILTSTQNSLGLINHNQCQMYGTKALILEDRKELDELSKLYQDVTNAKIWAGAVAIGIG